MSVADVMKMMKEKKMKMTPDHEKKLMKMLEDLNKLLDDVGGRGA